MSIYFGSTQASKIYYGSTAFTSLNYGSTVATSSAPLSGTTPSIAYATDRKLLSSYGGSFLTKTGSNVTTLFDQSGNTRNFSNDISNVTTTTVGTDLAMVFDGTASLAGPLISAVFGSTSTWVVMVVEPTPIDQNKQAAAVGGNVALGDKAEGGDMMFVQNGTAHPLGFGFMTTQYDGSYHVTPDVTAFPGARLVIQFRKDATKLYARVNLGTEVSIACNALTAVAFALQMGASNVGHFFKGKIYAMAAYADANVPSTRDAIVSALMGNYGILDVPSVSNYPSASTTGTSGTLTPVGSQVTLSTPGQTYSNADVTGSIIVAANNVTIQNCKVTSSNFWAIHVQAGVTGCVIKNCEVNGLGTANTIGIAYEPDAINGSVSYCNIYGCEDGIRPSSGTTVFNNYIHDFNSLNDSGHYDGIEMDGGQANIEIYNNRVENAKGQTSCVQMNNFAGNITNINVHNNWLNGGSYSFYIDGNQGAGVISGVTVSNNVLGIGGFGYKAVNSATYTHTGNIDLTTGQGLDGIL